MFDQNMQPGGNMGGGQDMGQLMQLLQKLFAGRGGMGQGMGQPAPGGPNTNAPSMPQPMPQQPVPPAWATPDNLGYGGGIERPQPMNQPGGMSLADLSNRRGMLTRQRGF